MTVLTDRPSSTQADGFDRSDSAVYALARASYIAGSNSNSGTTIITGQRNNAGTYQLFQGFVRFSLSTIPTTSIVLSATFEYTTSSAAISAESDLEMLGYDAGTLVEAADYQGGAGVGSLANYGTIDATANSTATTTYQKALNSTGVAAIQANLGGNFGMALIATDFVNNSAPAGDGRYTIRSSEDATAANRPALIVTYSENLGRGIVSGPKVKRMRIV